jgi:hypothetical protein
MEKYFRDQLSDIAPRNRLTMERSGIASPG